jgi:archaeosine-15-forming tRNA-guanine transglycosylase
VNKSTVSYLLKLAAFQYGKKINEQKHKTVMYLFTSATKKIKGKGKES